MTNNTTNILYKLTPYGNINMEHIHELFKSGLEITHKVLNDVEDFDQYNDMVKQLDYIYNRIKNFPINVGYTITIDMPVDLYKKYQYTYQRYCETQYLNFVWEFDHSKTNCHILTIIS